MRANVYKSLFWKFAEKIGIQAINFIITIILARILGPNNYGITALLTIFTSFATVIVQDGFNTALIRKKDLKAEDYTSTLIFSLGLAIICYFIIFFCSPLIARFYNNTSLTPMLRVLSLTLFPAALNSVQVAYLTKKFEFKKMFVGNFISALIAGSISIILAIIGVNSWAIIINQLLFQSLSCILLSLISKWLPTGKFSINSIKNLLGFGNKMLLTSLTTNLFLNIRSLLIGKIYDSTQLGYFNRGKSFPATLMDSINGTIQAVTLPTYSLYQNDTVKIKNMVRKTIRYSCYILFPVLIGLTCISKPLIISLLGYNWLNSSIFISIFSITYIFQPTQLITAQAFKALKKGNTIFFMELTRKLIEIALLLASLKYGPIYIAISGTLSGMVSFLLMMIPNKRILKYSIKDQLNDFLHPLVKSLIMGACILVLNYYLRINALLILILDILVGIVIYILISIITKEQIFNEIIYKLKNTITNYFQL